eukprot:2495357-Heterocapsa_arctica.AAC.1
MIGGNINKCHAKGLELNKRKCPAHIPDNRQLANSDEDDGNQSKKRKANPIEDNDLGHDNEEDDGIDINKKARQKLGKTTHVD